MVDALSLNFGKTWDELVWWFVSIFTVETRLSSLDPIKADCFCHELHIVQEKVDTGVYASIAKSVNSCWEKWASYIDKLAINPLLQTTKNKVPFI